MDRKDVERIVDEKLDAWKRELREEVRKMTAHTVQHVDDVLGREATRWASESAKQHEINAEMRRTVDEQKHEHLQTLAAAKRILDGTVTTAVQRGIAQLVPELEESRKLVGEIRLEQLERRVREEERAKQKAEREAEAAAVAAKAAAAAVQRKERVELVIKVCAALTPILAAIGAYAGMRGKVSR